MSYWTPKVILLAHLDVFHKGNRLVHADLAYRDEGCLVVGHTGLAVDGYTSGVIGSISRALE